MKSKQVLEGLLKGLDGSPKNKQVRENSSKTAILLSREKPETLYPYWDFFSNLLSAKNKFAVYVAIHVLANLVKTDKENRFPKIFDKYFSLLASESLMIAAHVASLAGKIVRFNPSLEPQVTQRLLTGIDEAPFDAGRKDLVKSHALDAFAEYFQLSQSKDKILSFVEKLVQSQSPRAKKAAEDFLKKFRE